METKDIKIGVGGNQTLPAVASGFRFESGTFSTGDRYIIVTPENGMSVVVKPGQQFRISQPAGNWTLRANDPAATVTGRVVLFQEEEDFADSNVFTAVQLDASLINNVTVNNTGGNPVPVTLGENPVTTIQKAMEYTNSFNSGTDSGAGVITAFTPAQNPNGIIIEQFGACGIVGTTFQLSLLAKSSAPTSYVDGDILDMIQATGSSSLTYKSTTRIEVPAGKGIYLRASGAENLTKSLLVTIL